MTSRSAAAVAGAVGARYPAVAVAGLSPRLGRLIDLESERPGAEHHFRPEQRVEPKLRDLTQARPQLFAASEGYVHAERRRPRVDAHPQALSGNFQHELSLGGDLDDAALMTIAKKAILSLGPGASYIYASCAAVRGGREREVYGQLGVASAKYRDEP